MECKACYPGSIGEIAQGNFQGKDILLSCPVNLYTEVKVFESRFPEIKWKNPKTAVFMQNLLSRWDCAYYDRNLDIEINSKIPRGKGFASSTADLCALYYALLELFKKEFNEQELIEECIRLEPTDSIIFKKMTLFEYKKGSFQDTIGDYFQFDILAFEGKSIIDTVDFNNKNLSPLADIGDLIQELICGIREKNLEKLAHVATESIIRNQHRLKYDHLKDVLSISKNSGGLGVIGAHSGDCLGIIFDDVEKLAYAKNHCSFNDEYKIHTLKTVIL